MGCVVAYVADEEYIVEKEIEGNPVISFKDLRDNFSTDDVRLVMGIGYKKMGKIKKEKFEQCKKMGFCFTNYIHPTAVLPTNAEIGEGNNILENVIIEVGAKIGNANLICGGTVIGHETIIGDYNSLSVRVTLAGNIVIGNNCFLGAASTVKNAVKFEDYVLLGATAYGFKNMEAFSVIVPSKSYILENKKSIDYL